MSPDIKDLLAALEDWRRAYEKLETAVPSPTEAEQAVAQAYERVLTTLQKEGVLQSVNQFLQTAAPKAQSVATNLDWQQELTQASESIIATELQSVRPLQLNRKDLTKLILAYLKTPEALLEVTDGHELVTLFPKLHEEAVTQLAESRSLSRKEKKYRKRKIATGVTFTVAGFGLIASNLYVGAPTATFSYILGGNALFQATRDLIGDEVSN
jgi:hypothetical protein